VLSIAKCEILIIFSVQSSSYISGRLRVELQVRFEVILYLILELTRLLVNFSHLFINVYSYFDSRFSEVTFSASSQAATVACVTNQRYRHPVKCLGQQLKKGTYRLVLHTPLYPFNAERLAKKLRIPTFYFLNLVQQRN